MVIVVDVEKYHDWVPVPKTVEPTREDHEAGLVMAANDHTAENPSWLGRVLKDGVTHATFCIPDSTWEAYATGRDYKGMNKLQHVALWLAKHGPSQSPQEHWTKITVEGEPEIETFLTMYFGLGGGAK